MRSQLPPRLVAALGLTDGVSVRRSASIILPEGFRTDTAYGQLSNGPDSVGDLALPYGGLIVVAFQGQQRSSVSGAGQCAMFLNTIQVVAQNTNNRAAIPTGAPLTQGTVYNSIATGDPGLTTTNQSTGDQSADLTTGQLVGVQLTTRAAGGPDLIFADPGVYNLSVQWKATSGTVFARGRRLWAMALGFANAQS